MVHKAKRILSYHQAATTQMGEELLISGKPAGATHKLNTLSLGLM